jgi:hypothetical protein
VSEPVAKEPVAKEAGTTPPTPPKAGRKWLRRLGNFMMMGGFILVLILGVAIAIAISVLFKCS